MLVSERLNQFFDTKQKSEVIFIMLNPIIRTNNMRKFNDNLFSSVVPNWDEFFPVAVPKSTLSATNRAPAVDIKETDSEFQLIADLPGISKDNLEVSVKDDLLSLIVRSEDEKTEESEGRIIRQERYRGTFQRSFRLNESVDEQNIQATYKDGVLSISVPKKEPVESKKIEVAVH